MNSKHSEEQPALSQQDFMFTPAQNLGFLMAILHFTKRVIECTGVHIYSKPTKSLNRLIWEMAYTWLFFGIGVSYYLFHPKYTDPLWTKLFGEKHIP